MKRFQEMKDEALVGLIRQIGYVEGLPVVVDPKDHEREAVYR